MKALVLVKHVPDTNSVFRVNSAGSWVDESSLSFTVNDFDRYALEELLKLKDAGKIEEVVALTVGPADAASVLRTCLATGADRAIHVKNEATGAPDPYVIARAIRAAIASEGFSLVLGGLQADDDNYTQVGGLVAGLLDWPFASAAVRLELLDASTLRVDRELEGNEVQVVELKLPAVVTVQTGLNTPRYASLKGIMAAKKKPVAAVTAEKVEAKLRTLSLAPPPKGKGAEILTGAPEEVAKALVSRIREKTGVL
ncbi:MAG TPA: electron transfer flavoprotein subunit beta/FixA family protein [Vicinamibacteria bacterium]|nr:electron transfer flavoprotein subunit beta/FixA family protein [Vicinamibacteria bacterium]